MNQARRAAHEAVISLQNLKNPLHVFISIVCTVVCQQLPVDFSNGLPSTPQNGLAYRELNKRISRQQRCIPEDYHLCVVSASDTRALEMAM